MGISHHSLSINLWKVLMTEGKKNSFFLPNILKNQQLSSIQLSANTGYLTAHLPFEYDAVQVCYINYDVT